MLHSDLGMRLTAFLCIAATICSSIAASGPQAESEIHQRIRQAYESRATIEVKMVSKDLVRGTVSSIDGTHFTFVSVSGEVREINYTDVASVSAGKHWRAIMVVGAVAAAALWYLRSECFYRC